MGDGPTDTVSRSRERSERREEEGECEDGKKGPFHAVYSLYFSICAALVAGKYQHTLYRCGAGRDGDEAGGASGVPCLISRAVRERVRAGDGRTRGASLDDRRGEIAIDIIESGRQKGLFRDDLKPTAEASFVMCTLNGALVQAFLGSSTVENQEMLSHLRAVLVERLRPLDATEAVQ